MTSKIENSVDVRVPVSTAYNQWTQFEEFPRFMRHVESVRQIDDRRLHWRVRLGGSVREFNAEIVEQIPDKRIAWRSTDGAQHRGVVTFHRLDTARCRVMLQMEFESTGLLEKVGTIAGVTELEIEKDMSRFVEFVEKRQTETGAWRGTIQNKDDARPGTDLGAGAGL